MSTETIAETMQPEPVGDEYVGSDSASFKDLKGREFTLRLPITKFWALRDTLAVDLTESKVIEEVHRVETDVELMFNVISFLIDDQLAAKDLTREAWSNDFFGEYTPDDPKSLSPMETAAVALEAVVVGFIPSRSKRTTVRNRLAQRRQTIDAVYAKDDEDAGSVSPNTIAEIAITEATNGKDFETRIREAASTALSGESPENPAATTSTDSASGN